ncbi:MAG: DUF1320 domain-containing protein [Acidimicrobiia bacterium]|nr:MAG: DUF1320 domain-containing protein [Acidimicrobiia bacterium]
MAYATQTTLEKQYGEDEVLRSGDRDADGVIDVVDGESVVDKACSLAQGVADSYLGSRYTVPLSDPIPEAVVDATGAIAMYKLSEGADTLTEEKRRRYEDAIAWLRDVAAGKASLGVEPPPPLTVGKPVRITAEARAWTRSTIGGIL